MEQGAMVEMVMVRASCREAEGQVGPEQLVLELKTQLEQRLQPQSQVLVAPEPVTEEEEVEAQGEREAQEGEQCLEGPDLPEQSEQQVLFLPVPRARPVESAGLAEPVPRQLEDSLRLINGLRDFNNMPI